MKIGVSGEAKSILMKLARSTNQHPYQIVEKLLKELPLSDVEINNENNKREESQA